MCFFAVLGAPHILHRKDRRRFHNMCDVEMSSKSEYGQIIETCNGPLILTDADHDLQKNDSSYQQLFGFRSCGPPHS